MQVGIDSFAAAYTDASLAVSPADRLRDLIATLTGFAEDGFDTLVLWPVEPSLGQVELLATEVVPLL